MKIANRRLKRIAYAVVLVFILMNGVAYFHAYQFTHFDPTLKTKTKDSRFLSGGEKLRALLFGVNNPRPTNQQQPRHPFETIRLKSNQEIECWLIKARQPKGAVILFHGFSGEKSGMLDKADVFLALVYSTLLVDFMGSGGSEGNQTTIGFYEAEEVQSAFDFLRKRGEKNVVLFGTSMGAAAIMKAQNDYSLKPSAIILECPFGTMLETVQARFRPMHVPSFPMANLLVFWGGFGNGFNAFTHNPVTYAKNIQCPTLLLYGEKDERVSRVEIDRIFSNLPGKKHLNTYALSGHENYLIKHKAQWTNDIRTFLASTEPLAEIYCPIPSFSLRK